MPRATLISLCLVGILLLGGACGHKRKKWRPTLVVRQVANLEYGPNIGYGANLLDLYLPPCQGPYPLIVAIHGGGWISGNKASFPVMQLARRGYAVASINYRLSTQATFPAQIIDCKTAVSWLRAHAKDYDIDANRIGVWGISAGGHLAALLGLTGDLNQPTWAAANNGVSNHVSAVCDWCGPADLTSFIYQGELDPRIIDMINQLLGTPPAVNPALAREASPTTYVNKHAPVFLIMHGAKDALVPVKQSQELQELLKSAGAESSLKVIHQGQHNFYSRESEAQVIDFFDQNLKTNGPLPKRKH